MEKKHKKIVSVLEALQIIILAFLLMIMIDLFLGTVLGKAKLLLMEGIIVVPAVLYTRFKGGGYRSVFRLNPVKWNYMKAAVFMGIGLSVLGDELDRLVQIVLPMGRDMMNQLNEYLSWNSFPEAVIVVCAVLIVAPLSEEALFRGFLQQRMEKATDATRGVLITSLVFGIMHMNPWSFVQIIVLGLFLGVAALATGSIWASLVIHSINNGIALILINVEPSEISWYYSGDHVSPAVLVCGAVLTGVGLVIFNKTIKNDGGTV